MPRVSHPASNKTFHIEFCFSRTEMKKDSEGFNKINLKDKAALKKGDLNYLTLEMDLELLDYFLKDDASKKAFEKPLEYKILNEGKVKINLIKFNSEHLIHTDDFKEQAILEEKEFQKCILLLIDFIEVLNFELDSESTTPTSSLNRQDDVLRNLECYELNDLTPVTTPKPQRKKKFTASKRGTKSEASSPALLRKGNGSPNLKSKLMTHSHKGSLFNVKNSKSEKKKSTAESTLSSAIDSSSSKPRLLARSHKGHRRNQSSVEFSEKYREELNAKKTSSHEKNPSPTRNLKISSPENNRKVKTDLKSSVKEEIALPPLIEEPKTSSFPSNLLNPTPINPVSEIALKENNSTTSDSLLRSYNSKKLLGIILSGALMILILGIAIWATCGFLGIPLIALSIGFSAYTAITATSFASLAILATVGLYLGFKQPTYTYIQPIPPSEDHNNKPAVRPNSFDDEGENVPQALLNGHTATPTKSLVQLQSPTVSPFKRPASTHTQPSFPCCNPF